MQHTYKMIIAGSRNFTDKEMLYKCTDEILNNIRLSDGQVIEIISGGARGADSLAIDYAKNRRMQFRLMPADWNNLGKSAGYIRNQEMLEIANGLIAFWDGESKGTKHMIEIARQKGIDVWVIHN